MCWNKMCCVIVASVHLDVWSIFPYSKWKADRAAVTSLCASPDGKLLLSAGQTIKMWDLDTKEVYRVSRWSVNVRQGGVTGLSDACLHPDVALIAEIHRSLHNCDDTMLRHHTTSGQQWSLFSVRGSTRSTAQCLVSASVAGAILPPHFVIADAVLLFLSTRFYELRFFSP